MRRYKSLSLNVGIVALVTALGTAAQPTISSVKNTGSFVPDFIAPGSIAAIFGSGLATKIAQPTVLPLPPNLDGVTVTVGDIPAPLFYISPGQINFQVPREVNSGSATLAVTVNGQTAAVNLKIRATAPGIFLLLPATHAAARNQDNSINGHDHPAPPGSVLTVYFTGEGMLDEAVADGAATPLMLIHPTAAVSATIGGQNASVQFAGLSPTAVALAQANLQIPSGLAPGDYAVSLTVGHQTSNTPVVTVGTSPIVANSGIPGNYFGMLVSKDVATGVAPWPTVPFGALRIWDDAVKWADINSAPGQYDWSTLDAILATSASHGVTDILYTFGATPSWASSAPADTDCKYVQNGPGICDPPSDLNPDGTGTDQHWIDFVTAIARHTAGKINSWEIWNEANDPKQWKGTAAQLARMANDARDVIRSIDPGAAIVAPSTAAMANQTVKQALGVVLDAGTGSGADVISFHGYLGKSSPSEHLAVILNGVADAVTIAGVFEKPIWNTEASWGKNENLPDPDQQAAYLVTEYLLQWGRGIRRFYWYRWDGSDWGTLWDSSSGLHLAGAAYRQVHDWMIGATSTGACNTQGTIWTCGFTRDNGYVALAVWDTSQSCSGGTCSTSAWLPPARFTRYLDLNGNSVRVTPNATVALGLKPIWLDNH